MPACGLPWRGPPGPWPPGGARPRPDSPMSISSRASTPSTSRAVMARKPGGRPPPRPALADRAACRSPCFMRHSARLAPAMAASSQRSDARASGERLFQQRNRPVPLPLDGVDAAEVASAISRGSLSGGRPGRSEHRLVILPRGLQEVEPLPQGAPVQAGHGQGEPVPAALVEGDDPPVAIQGFFVAAELVEDVAQVGQGGRLEAVGRRGRPGGQEGAERLGRGRKIALVDAEVPVHEGDPAPQVCRGNRRDSSSAWVKERAAPSTSPEARRWVVSWIRHSTTRQWSPSRRACRRFSSQRRPAASNRLAR